MAIITDRTIKQRGEMPNLKIIIWILKKIWFCHKIWWTLMEPSLWASYFFTSIMRSCKARRQQPKKTDMNLDSILFQHPSFPNSVQHHQICQMAEIRPFHNSPLIFTIKNYTSITETMAYAHNTGTVHSHWQHCPICMKQTVASSVSACENSLFQGNWYITFLSQIMFCPTDPTCSHQQHCLIQHNKQKHQP